MVKMSSLRLRNALLRECMAEFLGTFVLLVSDTELIFCFLFVIMLQEN